MKSPTAQKTNWNRHINCADRGKISSWKCCRRFSSLPVCLEPVAWPCWSRRVVCCATSCCTRGKVALSIGISNNSHSRLWHFVDGQHPPLFFRSLCSTSLSSCQDGTRPVNTRTGFGSRWASHWPFLLSDKMRLSFCPKHKKKQKSRLQTVKRPATEPSSRYMQRITADYWKCDESWGKKTPLIKCNRISQSMLISSFPFSRFITQRAE